MGATGGRTPPSKLTVALLVTSVVSAIWAAAMLTPAGRVAYAYVFVYAEFYFGVLALVFLSITVMAGVLATDRMILSVRQRVLLQSAHRTTGVISVASLVVHIVTKLAIGHITLLDAIIPFTAVNNGLFIGMGTVGAWLLFSTLWTGIVRARFIGKGKPWMWRAMHSMAYLAWPIALVHGLSAGRAAKTWVVVSYIACIALVLVTLIVRLSVAINRKKDFSSTSTGSLKPVGKLVPTATPSARRPARRDRDADVNPLADRLVSDRRNAPARDPWAASAPRAELAAARPEPRSEARSEARSETRPALPEPRGAADDAYRPAGRRPIDEPRGRRAAADDYADGYADDDPADYAAPRRAARRDARDDRDVRDPRDDRDARDDARYEPAARYDDEPARPRGRRRAAEDDVRPRRDDRPTQEWRAEDDRDERDWSRADRGGDRDAREYAPRRQGPRRYADDDEPVRPRGRRAAEPRYPERYDADARTDSWSEAPRPRRAIEDGGARSRWRGEEDEVPAPRGGRRRAEDDDERARPRARRAAIGAGEDDGPRSRWRADGRDPYEVPQPRASRYADDEPGGRPAWDAGADPNYLPPDDTPTLIDMASRRARRSADRDADRDAGRDLGRRAGRRSRRSADDADDMYWRQLRGEAQ
ncbi:translation initiation factor III [Spirilliplanes yamanashiensis]|uniref:translation initiation factor III n=1 Tax=Spirilliplanes yamanashiensis TaxID=42233 RepID=UPI001EF2838C|nr:translation initiation factor III [Spirilliplanes yamanashiensis]MDP9817704.1 hypothetical protein [Spirilliplanes yamanashiensis]